MGEKHKPSESYRETRESLNPRDDIDDLKKQVIWPKIMEIVEDAMFLNPLLNFWPTVNLSNKQNQIVDYIIEWKLWSGKNPQLEKDINELSLHPMAWKLKYLLDNSISPLEVSLSEIENKEKVIREKNAKRLADLQKQSEQLNNNKEEPSLIAKWWEWLTGKIKWIWANFVNFADVPEKLWSFFWNMLSRAESYIWKPYSWADCSMFVSKILCAWRGIWETRLWNSETFIDGYKSVSKDTIRCWDLICTPPKYGKNKKGKSVLLKQWHVELIVSKPYMENWVTYVTTIWSSTDTYKEDPMFDANWKPIKGKGWVWYRKRQIYPNPRHSYKFRRPPYEEWSKNRA